MLINTSKGGFPPPSFAWLLPSRNVKKRVIGPRGSEIANKETNIPTGKIIYL